MPNQLALSGAQPPKPSRRAPLYTARFSTGLWSNRNPLRDAASTRWEEKFYGARGDGLLGGENVEATQRLTLARRPGHSVYNNRTWNSPNCFYEFRQFNANQEQIKVMVDTASGLYDGTGPSTQIEIWKKQTGAGQSFMQSVGNSLYWGDGVSKKKWITTLQSRTPYVESAYPLSQNPYNFTPFDLDTFVIDSNGNAEQLIGTVLQLKNFYILNNTVVFSLLTTLNGYSLPQVYEVLSPGLEIYFPAGSQMAEVLGSTTGVTLTIQNIVGGILTVSPYFGGSDYTVGDIVNINQTSPAGSMNGQAQVASTGTASGTGYTTASAVVTTTSGAGSGCTLNINASAGALTSTVSVAAAGSLYAVNDFIFPVQVNAAGGYYKVTSVSGGTVTGVSLAVNAVTGLSVHTIGSGYYAESAIPTTGGTGRGLTVTLTDDETEFSSTYIFSGGPITSAVPSTRGTGYTVGDHIVPIESSSSTIGGVLQVASISGAVSAIPSAPTYGGPVFVGYTVGSPTVTSSGTGTGCLVNINSVSSGVITGVTLGASGGYGYRIGDLLYLAEGSVTGGFAVVTAVSSTVVTNISPGYGGYSGYTTTTGVSTGTSGTGTGATISITGVNGSGQITTGVIDAGGSAYNVGDLLYVQQTGTSGAAYFTVSTISGSGTGPVSSLSILDAGNGYITANNQATTGGTGSGLTVNLVVINFSYYPLTNSTDTPSIFSGGNPISDSRSNASFSNQWNMKVGGTTIDGSALWINRGKAIDDGLVYSWGIPGSTIAPSVLVNNAEGSWAANTYYSQWQIIVVEVSSSYYIQQLVTSGKSGASAPVSWNTTVGQLTTDGTAEWMCISNQSDTSLTWTYSSTYTPGHILEASSSVFELQPYAGIMTQGSNFPVYVWQCLGQSGSDVGAAAEFNNGGVNSAMAQNGGQSLASATYVGSATSLFLSTSTGSAMQSASILGDGTVGSLSNVCPGGQNLGVGMFPSFVIPAPGTYTFTIGHQVAMFWGIGAGTLSVPITQISVQGNILTATSSEYLASLVQGTNVVNVTFSGLTNATFLNGKTVSITSVQGKSFTASFNNSNYGPETEPSGATASTGATLTPTVVSGPMNWINGGSPNTYNFSTGTPVKGYPIMSANYPNQGTSIVQDTVEINFTSAGVYPSEIQYGVWYHSPGGYSAPVTSPVLPGTSFSFYMVYSKPGSTTNYNIMPQGIACSSSTTAPTFPTWPSTIASLQTLSPGYPTVTELSGNFTWNNLGPISQFAWTAATNYTTNTFIIDPYSDQELPYEPGISGSVEPTFSTTLDGLVGDNIPSGSTGLVWMNNGLTGDFAPGSLSTTQGGWSYVVALVNTLDNTVSNASLASPFTGNFVDATGVFISGGLPGYIDPQADYVAIFRTDDGGATYFLIPPPASGNGNTEYTVPLATYLTQGFTDTTLDSGLNTLLEAPIEFQNSVPPAGIINVAFSQNRLLGSVGNTAYWSTGPDTPIGNGFNGFSPNNYAVFPSLITKIVPLNIGWVVFTVSDIYVITGNGETGNPYISNQFLQRIGLLSYNALTINGSVLYFMTTDQQVLEINVHSGVSQIGAPIADQFTPYVYTGPTQNFTPSNAYLTWHVNGNNDQCLFVADGSTGWFRLSPTAAPESGLTWSPKANIVGGCKAVQSVETTPGNIQLLLGPLESGPILYRDYNTNADNGESYPANFILGSLVLAQPGQLADVEFITTDSVKNSVTINGITRNSLPLGLGVLIGEVSGEFEDLYYWTQDPPQLFPSKTTYGQRFYLSQAKQTAEMRHLQIYIDFETLNYPSEILSLSVYGGYSTEG